MPKKLVEIARSFAYKHNLGNYQSADFFCSQKAEVSVDKAEKTSEALYQFCKRECIKSLNEYLKEREPKATETIIAGVDFTESLAKFPKVYKAKDTDPWRKTPEVRYIAGGTRENPEKIEITKEVLAANTSEPY